MQRRELIDWLICPDPGPLLAAADRRRRELHGDAVELRAIVELSSHCRCDCLYCGLRRSRRGFRRFRLGPEQALATVREAARGAGTVVLQAGEDLRLDEARVSALCAGVRAAGDSALTLSLGERPRASWARWRAAGADRYLLKLETASPRLYARLRPGHALADRLGALETLRELGYQVGTGNLVGLPGQGAEELADDLLLLQRLDPEMIAIGPFLPHPSTPLAGAPAPRLLDLTLRCLALARLLLPRAHLPATTALGALLRGGRELGLAAGANVLMEDVTPLAFRRRYELYPGRALVEEPLALRRPRLDARLRELGRRLASGRGDALPRALHPPASGGPA